MSEHLTLVKLSDRTPKKEGYYFVVLHNSLKECLWWDEKDGFISRNADKHGVYGWYDDASKLLLPEEELNALEDYLTAYFSDENEKERCRKLSISLMSKLFNYKDNNHYH